MKKTNKTLCYWWICWKPIRLAVTDRWLWLDGVAADAAAAAVGADHVGIVAEPRLQLLLHQLAVIFATDPSVRERICKKHTQMCQQNNTWSKSTSALDFIQDKTGQYEYTTGILSLYRTFCPPPSPRNQNVKFLLFDHTIKKDTLQCINKLKIICENFRFSCHTCHHFMWSLPF